MRDLSRPGARLLELDLPDGERVRIAEHLCGWSEGAGAEEGDTALAHGGRRRRALTGRTRDGEAWISVLEEYATGLAADPGTPLPPDDDDRLRALAARVPSLYFDGPRAHSSGGWYMFIGGPPGRRVGDGVRRHRRSRPRAAPCCASRRSVGEERELMFVLQHVGITFPPGEADAIRAFYGEGLGMTEMPLPPEVAHLEWVWFATDHAGVELHFIASSLPPDPTRAHHFCLQVDDLAAARARLGGDRRARQRGRYAARRARAHLHARPGRQPRRDPRDDRARRAS